MVLGFLQRALIVLFCIVFSSLMVAIPANAAAAKRAYAGIVVDAKSGKTLYSRAADSPRYPASITKVMTLYVVFQELESGRMKLSTRMRVSKHAANAVPSKLGLKVGSTISVENAIKALVTKSANDVARVIAEHISGTETKFAQRMTKVARALGMKRTTYANASGLPNSRQVTTVRDQSRLGIAVYQHYPKYYKYFQTRSFKYKGRTYGNHNRLLGQNGVDGIKTGYIRASGFNLLTAARKNNRHIVVVAFGFDSGNQRNAKVASLVRSNLTKARRGNYVAQARIAKPRSSGTMTRIAVQVTPMPRLKNRMPSASLIASTPVVAPISQPIALASIDTSISSPTPISRPINLLANTTTAATPINLAAINATRPEPIRVAPVKTAPVRTAPVKVAMRPIDIIGNWISDTRGFPQNSGALALMPPANIGVAPIVRTPGTQAIDLMTSGSIDQATKPSKSASWALQVGAVSSTKTANNLIANAKNLVPELSNRRSFIEQTNKYGQKIYRARFSGFGDVSQAKSTCERLKENNINCLIVGG